MKRRFFLTAGLTGLFLVIVASLALAGEVDEAKEIQHLGHALPVWSVIPFAGILLSIALFPLFFPHFWHHHFPKVSLFWALVFAIPFLIAFKGEALHEILHIYIADYIPFIILLWSLFTVTGGIFIQGDLLATPATNTGIVLLGTVLASWMGTTGASVLLIRLLLRINEARRYKTHLVIFFIFLVSNIGGSLTPLGDPPLFLGFLHGVPFFWTFHLIPHMGFVVAVLIVLLFAIDSYLYKKEGLSEQKLHLKRVILEDTTAEKGDLEVVEEFESESGNPGVHKERLRIRGLYNIFFLLGIIGGVLFSGLVKLPEVNILGIPVELQNLIRDFFLILMGILSLVVTPKPVRTENHFTWFPIKEVAYLFAGIFMTIIPALILLRAGEEGNLGFLIRAVREPWHYFWITGSLSSFLDNAPTYLTFFNTALGRFYPGMPEVEAVTNLIKTHALYLEAISAGAVFMGAMTYIGNAPNFMVKSISEERGVKMPSFFGYMAWSIGILIPLFVVVNLIFFV